MNPYERYSEFSAIQEIVKKLEFDVKNPKDESGAEWFRSPAPCDKWTNYFYGSGDPADLDEMFIQNLSEYCFENFERITRILSLICTTLLQEGANEIREIEKKESQPGWKPDQQETVMK